MSCDGWLPTELLFLAAEVGQPNICASDEAFAWDVPIQDGPLIRVSNVSRAFGTVTALDDVSFAVERGEILGIIGRSGAGKSTLIRCLNGLEKPDRGRVEVLGQDIVPLREAQLKAVRGRIGMVFQHFNLLSSRTVADNVALPLQIAGVPPQERHARVASLLALVGLVDKAQVYPAKLSGGQKQRVGIARALAANPALLLCDEATSALDPETTLSILDLLRDINRRLNLTIVMITHEMSVVRAIADRVIVMERGAIIEEGEVWQVFSDPEAELTQRLIGRHTGELPAPVRNGLSGQWSSGAHLVLRLHINGEAARGPILAELGRDLSVLPVLLDADIQHLQSHSVARFVVAFRDAGESLARRIGEYLSLRSSRLEVLGYVRQLA
jgi:D-methionine transport system ATP-binding protein